MKHLHLTALRRVCLLAAFPIAASASGAPDVRVARYSVLPPVPEAHQLDLLQTVVTVRFPDTVTTVGGAVEHLLRRSGYLRGGAHEGPAVQDLMARPLPAAHRSMGPVTVRAALATLAGTPFLLVEDPVHRLVSYQIRPGLEDVFPDPAVRRAPLTPPGGQP